MNRSRSLATLVVAVAFLAGAALAACAGQARSTAPQTLKVTTSDYAAQGEYQLVDRDRIDGLTVANGRVLLKGTPDDLVLDLPPAADPARAVRHWALVTDAHVDGHRLIIFTHSESVKDVSIELPDGDAPIHFAAFAARTGSGEVLFFASGDRKIGPPSLFGVITINPR